MTRATLLVGLVLFGASCGDGATGPSVPDSLPAGPAETSTTTTTTTIEVETTQFAETTIIPDTAGDGPGSIAFVGCSMSKGAVSGYELLGGTGFWSAQISYGGGSIGRWASAITDEGTRYWEEFERQRIAHPETKAVWWNLCTFKGSNADSYDNAVEVLDEIESRLPGVVVYVSAQPAYGGGHVCALAGESGPALMEEVARQLVDAGRVEAGPVMGPLAEAETSDGCHVNATGKELLGGQLLGFFG